ncbi:MAG: SWIM zinc finger family protein [Clostridia bacterium]
MKFINLASNDSVWKGFDYYKENKVMSYKKIGDYEYKGIINGSDNKKYNTFIDIEHTKKSKCDCLHAKDKKIICKHIIALYFTIFPDEVDKFLKDVEEDKHNYEEYEKELENKLIKYINSMSKSELQQTVLELLDDVPEWVYNKFIRNNIR